MWRLDWDVHRMMDAARGSISLTNIDLPDEFYPAHLSATLIDAVFRPRLGERTATPGERHLGHFGIARTCAER